MPIRNESTRARWLALAACGLWSLIVSLLSAAAPAEAVETAEAATKSPVTISIFVSTRNDTCYERGDVGAITKFARLERDRINAQGGIAGHKLNIRIFDDYRDVNKATSNMREALADPDAVAMIGMSSSDRSKSVFDATGKEIADSGLPFLSSISVNSIFAPYPNVFTVRASQDDEQLPVLGQFVKRSGYARPAYVGVKDLIFSTVLGDGLRRVMGADKFVADHRLTLKDDKVDPAEVAAIVEDLKSKAPDIVFLGMGAGPNGEVLKAMTAAGVAPAIFVSGRISGLPSEAVKDYPSPLFELLWDRLPDVYNDRLMRRMAGTPSEDWVFEGEKIDKAPGWANGECKARPPQKSVDPLNSENLRAIGIGTQYADMIALVAASARSADRNADIKDLRAHVLQQLTTTYAAGRGAFHGAFENWSFVPKSRTATRTPFIVQLPPGLGRSQLAPQQFARLRDENLRPIGTQYLDIDLVRVFGVDDNAKSFFAEFYLSMRDDGNENSIDLLEFSNAVLNPETNDRQITVRTLSAGGKSEAYPNDIKIYHVSGRFLFKPNLKTYPFDTQRFSIDIRPKRGDRPFIIQPPPQDLRDTAVDADGWEPKLQFVGTDEDFVGTVDAKSHTPSVVPFYKASFAWMMARETTDYYLRVVVPLLFILIVAYLSIFIPLSHFEAIVTIQVTALLSAVALYLSLPAVDGDTTTLSDRIFLFNYMAVSLMILISVLRVNRFIAPYPRIQTALAMIHAIAIPAMCVAVALYIHRLSQGIA